MSISHKDGRRMSQRGWLPKAGVIEIGQTKLGGLPKQAPYPRQFFTLDLLLIINVVHTLYLTKLYILRKSCLHPSHSIQVDKACFPGIHSRLCLVRRTERSFNRDIDLCTHRCKEPMLISFSVLQLQQCRKALKTCHLLVKKFFAANI